MSWVLIEAILNDLLKYTVIVTIRRHRLSCRTFPPYFQFVIAKRFLQVTSKNTEKKILMNARISCVKEIVPAQLVVTTAGVQLILQNRRCLYLAISLRKYCRRQRCISRFDSELDNSTHNLCYRLVCLMEHLLMKIVTYDTALSFSSSDGASFNGNSYLRYYINALKEYLNNKVERFAVLAFNMQTYSKVCNCYSKGRTIHMLRVYQ
ncbi:uncharacterized protein TRIADDRAFT_57625 [Trichoplax adhaerens]|uniref:Uncharacterized protein n=1 Tax=Trichoplax adhaerens TaxID=10228 RepID=B3RZZ2_TRIAD|nr:predicted protein [Trichoplax adhaerens]EDV24299.1 predicted protein [Trichoplax adhaerens]|eukprot:XP_002113825.1 predicted protein [Trichoplax adhaerens]